MGKSDYRTPIGVCAKQWVAMFLVAVPWVCHALGMVGLAGDFVGKLPSSVFLNPLSALGFFLLWCIASNTATRTASKIATILYALWAIYFAVLELVGVEFMPAWSLHVVATAQIVTPLILAYTLSLVAANNWFSTIVRIAVWIVCAKCVVESYWALANSSLSLWIFDGMAANHISISAFREVYRWCVVSLDILAAIALAAICTSEAFANKRDPNELDPVYSPFNRYTLTTVIITAVLIAIS